MSEHPSLALLRRRVQKEHHRQIGNWIARRWARPSAVHGTWIALRLGLSANQVTLAALATGLASAAAIGQGSRGAFVAGVALGWLSYWLDHVDGQVARWKGTTSLEGVYLDYLMHHILTLALGFGLGHGLMMHTGHRGWSTAGFLVAIGWALLSVQNDCRYKAVFQRLKREVGSFRVEGGAGGRPAAPPAWPRRGLGSLTWPSYKACEVHVVLTTLLLLALLAPAWPAAWILAWKSYSLSMAVGAPLLAAGRIVRALRRRAVTAEFDGWLTALDEGATTERASGRGPRSPGTPPAQAVGCQPASAQSSPLTAELVMRK
jgi:hypothetical protein